jgi:hypothetical protein
MISRLRESKARFDEKEFERGKNAGQRWAEKGAKWEEVESLSRHTWAELSEGPDLDDWSSTIAYAIDPDADSEAVDNLQKLSGSDAMSEEFAHGFFGGATDAFSEVRNEV